VPVRSPQILNVDFIRTNQPATIPLGFLAGCTTSEAAGDPVIFSDTTANVVERLTSNVYDTRLVVGIIHSKPTSTTAFVVTTGVLANVATGLAQGQTVWVSPTGGLTTTRPTTGHLQVIGSAIGSTDVSVSPEERKTILS
jgi:hypothetical protein